MNLLHTIILLSIFVCEDLQKKKGARMRSITIIAVTLLIGLATAAPTTETFKYIITEDAFLDELSIYTGKHDIVEIIVPLNDLKKEGNNSIRYNVFFVEADKDDNGDLVSKGLYVMKNNVTTKLLENGRSAAAANDDTNIVYLAATDGLYIYNATTNKAEKYGPITDNIVGIAKENGKEALYILTAAHKVYKVTDNGNKKVKLNIENATQIVLDYQNNIYFLAANKEAYVYSNDTINKIWGLPEAPTYAKLLRPSPFVLDDGVPIIINDAAYAIYASGDIKTAPFEILVKPSAYSTEAQLIQFYAHKKTIYKYNIPVIVNGELFSKLLSILVPHYFNKMI